MITTSPHHARRRARLQLGISGAVQGVGFRPFVYRLANELGLTGWVSNSAQGVRAEIEGPPAIIEQFQQRLEADKPAHSFIRSCETAWLDAFGYEGFVIRESAGNGAKTALVLPDLATCPDCVREIFDPTNRRHQYPFTNCTHCGPRFSIITALPYDRANTTMQSFGMCPACQAEYDNPDDRRFHAQPNACPVCGPQLELWPGNAKLTAPGEPPRRLARGHDALLAAVHVIRCGHIVGVKNIGGFHLLVDARNDAAVCRLRERKQREEKPFALLFPTLASVQAVCEVSALEARLLQSSEAPIVLLKRLNNRPHPGPLPQERENGFPLSDKLKAADDAHNSRRDGTDDSCSLPRGERVRVRASAGHTSSKIARNVAPGNPNLGVMLPSNPLQHLIMAELGFPVVATSGNLGDEPICTDELEALERLRGIADGLLIHNRPIVRHVDDSIVRVMQDRPMVLRRARGYAPLPIAIGGTSSMRLRNRGVGEPEPPPKILAVGAHLKNSVALAAGEQVFLSQHIGDLETEPADNAFRRAAADLPGLYEAVPTVVAADLHPDYLSTKFAKEITAEEGSARPAGGAQRSARPTILRVQHHIAHVLSCIAENEVTLPALGIAWDGTGYGPDGTIWGGEFFLVTEDKVERVAHLRPFRLPGGDVAVKEPRRAAIGLLYELLGDHGLRQKELPSVAAFSALELCALKGMLTRNLNAPRCSSIGRLFDAVASLIGLRQQLRHEGQAAAELEFAAEAAPTEATYSVAITTEEAGLQLDWGPLIQAIIEDIGVGAPPGLMAAKFHNALVAAMVQVAQRMDCPRVVLSGGCFQNRYLAERTIQRLWIEGFQPYWHQQVPPNDGGIALGQIVAAQRELARTRPRAVRPRQRDVHPMVA